MYQRISVYIHCPLKMGVKGTLKQCWARLSNRYRQLTQIRPESSHSTHAEYGARLLFQISVMRASNGGSAYVA